MKEDGRLFQNLGGDSVKRSTDRGVRGNAIMVPNTDN